MQEPFSTPPEPESTGEWIPLVIGAGVILIILAGVFLLSRNRDKNVGPPPEAPYASNLQISDVKMSQAQNFVGAQVTYLEGNIANSGSRVVNGITVESVFRNSLGEVVGRESQPLMILEARPGYNDAVSLKQHPLQPNERQPFRLTFEHISADWNQGVPELRIVDVKFK
ncbi:MAG TPA: hypothetical protein VKW78_08465 [Terriglobales bacterium]|nr:hypothetical protein [Terriglobales bacterium]